MSIQTFCLAISLSIVRLAVRDSDTEGIRLKFEPIMDAGQSMYRQHRLAWLVMLMVCIGFSAACASNPTNIAGISEVSDIVLVESASALEKADSASTIKTISSGDHEQDLESSLQEFDEKLLRELEQAQQERQESARQKAVIRSDAELEAEADSEDEGESEASASGKGDENSEESNKTTSSDGQESSDDALSEQSGAANSSDQNESSSREREGSASTQESNVPTGDDDDIIARQLREAAEAETDPEIKEKLWTEYRKYKNQQGTSAAP